MAFQHESLAAGRWHTLSLHEQMGNIGGEISRAQRWRGKDIRRFEGAAVRALELFDLTLRDPKFKGRRKEIARAREVFCDAVWGDGRYATDLSALQRYFDAFAIAARIGRRQPM